MSTDLSAHIDHVLTIWHAPAREKMDWLDARIDDSDLRLFAPWRNLRDHFRSHMDKEENVLFPAILALADGGEGSDYHCALDAMEYEHEIIGTLEVALREAARDSHELEGPILTFLDDLVDHATYEDTELFPAARELLAETMGAEPQPEPAQSWRPVTPPLSLRARLRKRVGGLLHRH